MVKWDRGIWDRRLRRFDTDKRLTVDAKGRARQKEDFLITCKSLQRKARDVPKWYDFPPRNRNAFRALLTI